MITSWIYTNLNNTVPGFIPLWISIYLYVFLIGIIITWIPPNLDSSQLGFLPIWFPPNLVSSQLGFLPTWFPLNLVSSQLGFLPIPWLQSSLPGLFPIWISCYILHHSWFLTFFFFFLLFGFLIAWIPTYLDSIFCRICTLCLLYLVVMQKNHKVSFTMACASSYVWQHFLIRY